ncbi:hypothetical protein ABGT16_05245 [Pseudomonas asiatica]|uniref:hypothetical protein n=1 Tax=Pseudomonas asiatica TaxID=2219225 RepID=UPI00345C7E5F
MTNWLSAALCGVIVGIAIVAAGKVFILDPLVAAQAAAEKRKAHAESLRRDAMVAEHIAKLDGDMRLVACQGYMIGLVEQRLAISSVIKKACSVN